MEKRKLNQMLIEGINLFKKTWWLNVRIFSVPVSLGVLVDLFWGCDTYLGRLAFDRSMAVFDFLDLAIRLIVIEFFIFSLLAVIDNLVQNYKGIFNEAKSSLRKALRLFLPVFWLVIVFSFKIFLWSLLFVIPGIIAFIFYGATLFCFVADGKRGGKAIKMSVSLIKPNVVWYLDSLLFIVFVVGSCVVAWVRLWDVVLLHFLHLNNQFLAYTINYLELFVVFGAGLFFLCFYMILYDELKNHSVSEEKISSSES